MTKSVPILLTQKEVAARLRIDPKTLRKMMAANEIKHIFVGGRRKFHPDDVNSYLDDLRRDRKWHSKKRVRPIINGNTNSKVIAIADLRARLLKKKRS